MKVQPQDLIDPLPAATSGLTRTEHDLLGDRQVPLEAYYGVHSVRAVENFPISGVRLRRLTELINAIAAVKQASALTNAELGLLPQEKADAIVEACQEIRAGALHDHFVVDVIQGGAGTSTNMNANEVVANRGLEVLGYARGRYEFLHPVDDVNRSQSTNDVYPTAAKVATYVAIGGLLDALETLQRSFAAKAVEFADVVAMGRTQLQDAVPMTLGQEFGAYAETIDEDRRRLAEARALITEINLGGTAVGTGLNAPREYPELARAHLAEITGIPLVTSPDLVEATQDAGAFVQLSGVLKRIAVKLSKTCNDLRLLSSGPRAGFGDITLPAVQAGSSIMPGKVNPVIPEVVNQVAFEVIGNDVTITMAAEAGQLQLNAFEPVIVHRLFMSIDRLRNASLVLASKCVDGIVANREHLRREVLHSIGLATALNPYIGYAAATALAQEALATGAGVAELALEHGLVEPDVLAQILAPENLVGMRRPSTSDPVDFTRAAHAAAEPDSGGSGDAAVEPPGEMPDAPAEDATPADLASPGPAGGRTP
ncbi:fumarate lyase [Beutenbergia cavernae DSM 12333]|uniref:Fumarate lyase n=1 Tax=Beutenbergia cavernae (strain ATCC BAA-8 / DSM 12333 / CCUG 43141 / JCM 11478 / NBRC 16432 / NCIMB 13614 / HKI 0122) TaxID=471853 RepID=C5C2S8_BEUC1|nr:aspartate ammonia-lyase [Beutenbergia cavernae]ACQ81772.1 fumarate lyase [Beutenbergia cavernae DSM 12333]